MNRSISTIVYGSALVLLICRTPLSGSDSWPQFRGPNGNGIATPQQIPTHFGESKNVAWKTEIPGRAWSSPVVADGLVWMTTAIEQVPTNEERLAMLRAAGVEEKKLKQLAIAKSISLKLIQVDFATGELRQTIDLVTIEEPDQIHSLNSYASPTPWIDENRIYCHFGTYGTFCLDRRSGEMIWQRTLPLQHSVGPGSSPFIFEDRLVLIQDGVDRQYVTALNKMTGETIWETDRPEMRAPSGDQKKAYCTPIAATDKQGRRQLICMGSQWMVAYDPQTGDEIWKVDHGSGFSVVPRPVIDDGVVYFSTGFGKPELWAVRIDGTGDVTDSHVVWRELKGISKKPSPLLHDGLIYVMSDDGIASCLSAADGEVIWKKRIGGDYSSSPLLAGGHIYFGSHDGKVTVIQPGKEGKIVAENHLDGQIMASPLAVNDVLILRTDKAIYRIETAGS